MSQFVRDRGMAPVADIEGMCLRQDTALEKAFVPALNVKFKRAALVYRAVNGTAPRWPSKQVIRVSDMPSWTHPRSSYSSQLAAHPSRRVKLWSERPT